jgi:hypothetical protein
MSTYPAELIQIVRARCAELDQQEHSKAPPLPPDSVLEGLLNIAFHASFLSEEGRRSAFTITFLPASEDFSQPGRRYFNKEFRKITFERPRPYSVSEIHRLVPAAEMTRLLIGVQPAPEGSDTPLEIWGLLDIGENWWRFAHHETSGGKPLPNAITVTSLGPGELVVSAEGRVLVGLRAGSIYHPEATTLWTGPVGEFLAPARQRLHDNAIARLGVPCWDERGRDEDFPQRLYVFFLERILVKIHERRHGGMLVVVPSGLSRSDARVAGWLSIKYPSDYDCAWDTLIRSLANRRRFDHLHRSLWNETGNRSRPSFREYRMLIDEKAQIDEALADQSQAIACLSSVDGAVVMNDQFAVLGFGAELTTVSPALTHVILHAEGQTPRPVPIDSFGMRHRSAFRLCSTLEDAVVFVVSQDGGIKAVKRVDGHVLVWPDITPGKWGYAAPTRSSKPAAPSELSCETSGSGRPPEQQNALTSPENSAGKGHRCWDDLSDVQFVEPHVQLP